MKPTRTRLHWSYLPRTKYPALRPLMFSPEGMVLTIKFLPQNSTYPEDYYDVFLDCEYIASYINLKIIDALKINKKEQFDYIINAIQNESLKATY